MTHRAQTGAFVLTVLGLYLLSSGHLHSLTSPQGPRQKALAQEEPSPAPVDLYEADTIAFSVPAPMVFQSDMRCDLHGNIYLVYSDIRGFGSEVIYPDTPLPAVRKLALDSRTVVSYAVQSVAGYEVVQRTDFAVDPRGTVHALLQAYHRRPNKEHKESPDYLIAKFKDDGTIDSSVKLRKEGANSFEPYRFAAFLDGNFLVTGSVLSDRRDPEKPFTGIFDRAGLLMREVKPSGDAGPQAPRCAPETAQPKLDQQPSGAAESGQGEGQGPQGKRRESLPDVVSLSLMTSAPDGNIYLLRPSNPVRIYAVSPIGEVVHEWTVAPPRSDVAPMEMSLAGQNRLLLVFVHAVTPQDPKTHMVFALLDLGTGLVTATYQLPAGKRGLMPACMTPRDEFFALGTTEDRKLKVVKFVAR